MADTNSRHTRSDVDRQSHTRSTPSKTNLASLLIKNDLERPGKRPRLEAPPSPIHMTAAAAIADARQRSKSPLVLAANNNNNNITNHNSIDNRTSLNPQEAVKTLLGQSQNAVTKVDGGPTSISYPPPPPPPVTRPEPGDGVSDGLLVAAQHMLSNTDTNTVSGDSNSQTSPVSMSSYGNDSVAALARPDTMMASPQPLDTPGATHATAAAATTTNTNNNKPHAHGMSRESVSPEDSGRAFSYSSAMLHVQHADGRRGMSLPHSGVRHGTRSPSMKKHKCPCCATEFTRHHNLKSHLLTHSQEKPYVCPTCQSRFRRLHDLKRHTKLHTGERPHMCDKCKRRFARGDALARHNKGPGGCAGRRASMGSFGGEDDFDGHDDSMDGVVYHEPESMDDGEDGVSKSTPSIRRQAPSGDDHGEDADHYGSRVASTYPPIQGRPPGGIAGGAFPPRPPVYGQVGTPTSGPPPLYAASGSSSSTSLRPHAGPVFAQNPMTESPKPLSPGQSHNGVLGDVRHQSPSTSQHGSGSRYGRAMSIAGQGVSAATASGPQLPPPHTLNPPEARFTVPSQGAPAHPPTQPSGPPTMISTNGPLSSHSNSLSSHGHSGHGSMETTNSIINKDDRIWAYVKDLESRMNTMYDEIRDLRAQLAASTAARV